MGRNLGSSIKKYIAENPPPVGFKRVLKKKKPLPPPLPQRRKPTLPKKPRSVVLKAVQAKKRRDCDKYKGLNTKSKAELMRLL